MALYVGDFSWPSTFEFKIMGTNDPSRVGSVSEIGDHYFLRPSSGFSFSSIESSARTLVTQLDGVPALIRGHIFVHDGIPGLRVDEVLIGTEDPTVEFISVRATFELLSSVCSYRPEDGPARSARVPLDLPAIASAPEMSLLLGASGVAVMTAASPTSLDHFDDHLASLQDLITFAADNAAERLSLVAIMRDGREVTVLGRTRFAPFGNTERPPIEILLRLGATYTQSAIERWWVARKVMRPLTQVLAGLRYQPGWVEMDLNILAACVELFGQKAYPTTVSRRISTAEFAPIETALNALRGLTQSQRSFINHIRSSAGGRPQKLDESIDAVVTELGLTIGEAGIDPVAWKRSLIEARNGVSHAGGAAGLSDPELRSVRDATRVALSLALLKYLGVSDPVLARDAERLKVRYALRHRGTAVFS